MTGCNWYGVFCKRTDMRKYSINFLIILAVAAATTISGLKGRSGETTGGHGGGGFHGGLDDAGSASALAARMAALNAEKQPIKRWRRIAPAVDQPGLEYYWDERSREIQEQKRLLRDSQKRYNNQRRQRTQWTTKPSYPSYLQYPVQPAMQQKRPWYKRFFGSN
jgi:hypothetical protein